MLSCFAAKKLGAKHTVARIRNEENTNQESLIFMKNNLGLSMDINPEKVTAQAIYNIIKLPFASKVETFSSGFEMIEIQLKNESLEGKTISEIREEFKINFLIAAVSRDGEIFIPNGAFEIKDGDKLGIIAREQDLSQLIKLFGIEHKAIKNVMIFGGGRTSVYLAQMLAKSRISTKIIEKSEERCEELCTLLEDKVSIIKGDGMSQELLAEEGISDTDAFVALTGIDEQNILACVYASSQSVPKIISKVNRAELLSIANKVGVDTVVTPRTLIADRITRYARALQNASGNKMETLYSLMDGNVEALEFRVGENFKHVEIALKELSFKRNTLLAGIVRKGKSIIPTGDDVILADDKVIVIASTLLVKDLEDMFN